MSRSSEPSPEDHRALFELANALLAVFDLNGHFERVNPAWERLLGYPADDLVGEFFLDWVHPEDRTSTLDEALRLGRQSTEVVAFESRFRHRDGDYLWLSWNVRSDVDKGRTYAAAFDVSERKQAEDRLRQTVEMRRSVTESSPDHILMLDVHGRVLYNNRAETDRPMDSMLGGLIYEHVDAAYHEVMRQCFGQVLASGELGRYEIKELSADGSERILEARVGPIQRRSKVVALSVTLTDVTQVRRSAADREQLIRQLEAKNEELERYTYTVSHDLKSPLVTIKGFLGFLEKNALAGRTDRVKDDISRIGAAADRMRDLLDELLELSRVGRVVHPPEEIALSELVREATAIAVQPSDDRTLEIHIDPELPTVMGDRVRLFQVFQNLIDNASKFLGDQPSPRIDIGSHFEAGERVLFVRDNGIGVDPRYQERIFGLFDKLDPQSGGTGVGLALVRRIVELHGGRIWVDSAGVGEGSAFCFTLPIERSEG